MHSKTKQILEKAGVLLQDDHFVYTSGLHGKVYFDKDRVYLNPSELSELCQSMAQAIPHNEGISAVIAPAVGGVALSQWVAYHLTKMHGLPVAAVFARKDLEHGFVFKGSYPKAIKKRRVWVVEDVLNSGNSARKLIEVARGLGANIRGLSVLCNRGGHTSQTMNVSNFHALATIEAEAWPEEDCPLCATNVPVNVLVGHGAAYVKARAK